MAAREELEKAMSRCKISRRQRSLLPQRAEERVSGAGRPPDHAQHVKEHDRLDDAGDKKPEARSRTEDCLRAGEDASGPEHRDG